MASPSSATRAAISSREIRMRPRCRSTIVSARLDFWDSLGSPSAAPRRSGCASPCTGGGLLEGDEGGERTLSADPVGGGGRFLARAVGADSDPEASVAVLGGHAGHVGVEAGGSQLLPGVLGLAATLVRADLDGPGRGGRTVHLRGPRNGLRTPPVRGLSA